MILKSVSHSFYHSRHKQFQQFFFKTMALNPLLDSHFRCPPGMSDECLTHLHQSLIVINEITKEYRKFQIIYGWHDLGTTLPFSKMYLTWCYITIAYVIVIIIVIITTTGSSINSNSSNISSLQMKISYLRYDYLLISNDIQNSPKAQDQGRQDLSLNTYKLMLVLLSNVCVAYS